MHRYAVFDAPAKPQFALFAWQKPHESYEPTPVPIELVQLPGEPPLFQARLHGQTAPGASRAPAVVGPETDVVPGNHC